MVVACAGAVGADYVDVLDTPSRQSALAARRLLNAVALAGERLVTVGIRGHIVYSDDAGAVWKQAAVPVSSDLCAVTFPSASKGWAAGHDGVVLASVDGGLTWTMQLDGIAAARLIAAHIEANTPVGEPEGAKRLAEAKRLLAQGADKPFLDIWFEDERTGYVVGAFNLAFRTLDGGATWQPLHDRLDNPSRLHLYSVRGSAGKVYIAGEQGLVMRLDRAMDRFVALPTGYKGSFFGIVVRPEVVVTFGLRGSVFRSTDAGQSWRRVAVNIAGGITAGAALENGRIILVTQGGQVLGSRDFAQTFDLLPIGKPMSWTGVSPSGKQGIALVGLAGVRVYAMH